MHITTTQVATSVPFDNTTNGYIATDVQAAIEETNKHLLSIEVSSTTNATTTSGTDSVITTMSITPAPGTYIVFFSASIQSTQAGAVITYTLYNNGTADTSTIRLISPFDGGTLSATTAIGAAVLQRTVTVTAGAIDIRWKTTAGTATAGSRTLTLLRIG